MAVDKARKWFPGSAMRTTLTVLFLSLIFGSAEAAYVDLAWDSNPEPNLAGYRVYYGTASGKYTNSIDVGKTTAYRLTGLSEGLRYYLAVTAYDTAGNESDLSEEVYAVGIAEVAPEEEKSTPPSQTSLSATEEEVRAFFASYVDDYNQKNADGFLSKFSSKAVQNGTDRIGDIREMYTRLFDQSRELQYHLEDMRVEIYQNAVKAGAHFTVDQIPEKSGRKKTWGGNVHWILVRENGALRVLRLDYEHWELP